MPKSATTTFQKTTLKVPEPIYDIYAERALKFGTTPEVQMTLRLESCASHTDNGIWLDSDARNALSQIAGRTFNNPQDLLAWARQISSINVAGTQVELSQLLLTRLASRAFGRPIDDHIRKTVTEQLEVFTGMR